MTRRVSFSVGARRDILVAVRWFSDNAPDQAQRFVEDARKTSEGLTDFPEAHPVLRQGARRVALGTFKYNLWYKVRGETVWIIAVVHQHRGPGYLDRRIGERG